MVADLRLFRRTDGFLVEAVAAVRDTLLPRLEQFVIMEDVTIADVSENVACLTVIGPAAATATAVRSEAQPKVARLSRSRSTPSCAAPSSPSASAL